MSEYDEIDDETEETGDEGVRGIRKAQRATDAENKRLREELEQAQADRRELAAVKLGLDTSNKVTAKFMEHYDGDLSIEAMKAAAIEWGVLPEQEDAAAASTAGQAQMAQAFQGGEQVPLGTTTIGPGRTEVPADQAEMWSEFESALKASGGRAEAGADVLRRYGHQMDGIVDHEPIPGANGPSITPISGMPI